MKNMLKKLNLLIVAFVMGAVISLAIQACGNSKIEKENNIEVEDVPSMEDDSTEYCNCAWQSQKIASQVSYYEDGLVNYRNDYKYDNAGRLTVVNMVLYSKNSSGKRYLSMEQECSYTYADSDNIRHGTILSIYYDESGKIINQIKTTEEIVLYK